MRNFKNLEVWRLGFKLGNVVYRVTRNFPQDEVYGLTSQVRRASVSISSNIAEGCGRGTDKDFRSFLYNSLGSLKEVETQILLAYDFGYLSAEDFQEIMKLIDILSPKLTSLIKIISEKILI